MAFEQVRPIDSLDLRVSDDVALTPALGAVVSSDAEIDTELVAIMQDQGRGIAEHVKLFGDGGQPEWRGAHFVLPLHYDMHAGFLEALGLEPYCPILDTDLRSSPPTTIEAQNLLLESREAETELVIPAYPTLILTRRSSVTEMQNVSQQEQERKVQATLSYTALRQEVVLNLVD